MAERGSFILTPWVGWQMDPAQGKAASTELEEHPQESGIFSSPHCLSSPGSTRCNPCVPERSCTGAGKGKGRTGKPRSLSCVTDLSLTPPHPIPGEVQQFSPAPGRETEETLGWAGGSSTSPGQGKTSLLLSLPPAQGQGHRPPFPRQRRDVAEGTPRWHLEWPREGESPSRWPTALPEESKLCRE